MPTRVAFEDVVPVKIALLHFCGLSILALLSPSSKQDLIEYALLTIFMLSWIYAFVATATNGHIIVTTTLTIGGWFVHAAYIFHRWQIRNLIQCWQSDLAFYNSILQAVASCPPAAYMLYVCWDRKTKGYPTMLESPTVSQPQSVDVKDPKAGF